MAIDYSNTIKNLVQKARRQETNLQETLNQIEAFKKLQQAENQPPKK